ncbi:unnamed protein product [Peniophora sp. CBMAI 1063]|nr:unnamed protein product [Peniophora sp. CBMAI 1063]
MSPRPRLRLALVLRRVRTPRRPSPTQQQQPFGSYRPYKGREMPGAGSGGLNQGQKPNEGVAETLIGLSNYRDGAAPASQAPSDPPPPPPTSGPGVRAPSPTPSMRSRASHHGSVSSTRSAGQGSRPAGTKPTHSADRDDSDGLLKRAKMGTPVTAATSLLSMKSRQSLEDAS